MERESFERSLSAFSKRAPFRPFVVELINGHIIQIDHPEAVVARGPLAIYFSPGGDLTVFDHEGVARIETIPKPTRKSG